MNLINLVTRAESRDSEIRFNRPRSRAAQPEGWMGHTRFLNRVARMAGWPSWYGFRNDAINGVGYCGIISDGWVRGEPRGRNPW